MTPLTDRNYWKGKRVLITGAAGFVGRYVTDALLEKNAEVVATSRRDRSSVEARAVQWVRLDLSDRPGVESLIGKMRPHVVFHLSSLANGARDSSLVVPTFEAEVVTTLNLLLALHNKSVESVVLPGSLEEPEGEDTPSSPYAAAKVTTRNYARMFQLLYGLPIVYTRVFMCYGPGQPDWKLIPYLIRCFQSGSPPAVASPDRAIDWIFAGDAAQGLLAAASIPSLLGRTIDVGSGRLVTIGDIAEKVRALTNSSVEGDYGAAAPRAHEQTRCADAEATFRLTGWRARVPLDEGLKITINANGEDG